MEVSTFSRLLVSMTMLVLACVQAGTSRVIDVVSESPDPVCNLLPSGQPESFPLRFSTLDFGRLNISKTVSVHVWFENVTDKSIYATYSRTPLGSTCANVHSRLMAPGEKQRIDVLLGGSGRLGEQTRQFYIETGVDYKNPTDQAFIPIKAFIVPRVLFTPTKIYLMEVPTTTGKETAIQVCGHSNTFDIKSISASNDDGRPGVVPLEFAKGPPESVILLGEQYIRIPVTVTIPPGTAIGEHMWNIRFQFSGVAEDDRP